MPALSNRQSVIAAALQHAQQLCTQYYSCCSHLQLLYDEFSGSSSESAFSDSRSSGDSTDSTSTSSSADTSTSQVDDSYSSTTGSHLGDAELNWVLADLCHLYLQSLYHTWHFMCILLSSQVLFPHNVPKCSQLGLILQCYKEDDPQCFCWNLCVSPSTFSILLAMIGDNDIFHNDSVKNSGQFHIN